MTVTEFTKEEVQTFADKLDSFGQSLSLKEQTLLRTILQRAASVDGDDVHGFDYSLFDSPHGPSNPYAGAGPTNPAWSGHEFEPAVQAPIVPAGTWDQVCQSLGYVGDGLYSPKG